MIRFFTRRCYLGVMVCLSGAASPAFAQLALRPELHSVGASQTIQTANASPGELHGDIRDERGLPVIGAVVSALGSETAFAVSDRQGRFTFRSLAPGPYLVRAHLQGYIPARGRIFHVAGGVRNVSSLVLTRRADAAAAPTVLAAGVGPVDPADADVEAEDAHAHGEVAWRMRHGKRSVLKDAEDAVAQLGRDASLVEHSFDGLGWAVGSSARMATALFSDLPVNGQINFLTTTSFDRPQDLFSVDAGVPRGVAYVSLASRGAQGDWTMKGTMTQGDVSSWIVAGSYVRRAPAAHAYEAGVSYSMQRYLGGNGEALAAVRDGSRNVGSMHAYDTWTVIPQVRVAYGAKYDSYDYLVDRRMFSPRASVSIKPAPQDSLTLRASVSHGEIAPGAQEFLPPAVGLWLPPERTFSHVSRDAFRPERIDHAEVSVERAWPGAPDVLVGVRAFRQRVGDQIVTLFGVGVAEPHGIGHYQVGSAGDIDARGWGLSVSTGVTRFVRASVDYTQLDARWTAGSDAPVLARLARSSVRDDERVHDVTTSVESVVAPTATRLFVVYKINTGFTAPQAMSSPMTNTRFNVQVNQALPFLDFTSADWEMLAAVSNLFHSDVFEGSMYDELLVVRPPKRVLGGVTVKF